MPHQDLAIAFYPGPHRDVSSALFAKAIGGKIGSKSSFAHLLRRVDAARRESLEAGKLQLAEFSGQAGPQAAVDERQTGVASSTVKNEGRQVYRGVRLAATPSPVTPVVQV